MQNYKKIFKLRYLTPDLPLYSSFKIINSMGKYQKEKTGVNIQDLLKKPEDWELNTRCIKSIKYKHHKNFKNISSPKLYK